MPSSANNNQRQGIILYCPSTPPGSPRLSVAWDWSKCVCVCCRGVIFLKMFPSFAKIKFINKYRELLFSWMQSYLVDRKPQLVVVRGFCLTFRLRCASRCLFFPPYIFLCLLILLRLSCNMLRY